MAHKNSILLDVDPSITENNLLINKDVEEIDSFESLLSSVSNKNNEKDSRLVNPLPGFCVKTWKENSHDKVFINVCHTEHIPPPDDVTEAELIEMLKGVDDYYDGRFRIPMSIGQLHAEHDKGGHPCDVYDVAVNSNFFNNKVLKNLQFKIFLVTVALEGVIEKYNLSLFRERDPIILKNCKCIGKIQTQNIQIREKRDPNFKSNDSKKCLIEEIDPNDESVMQPITTTCPYQISIDSESSKISKSPESLTVNVLINEPMVTSSKDLTLDIGEDRILLRTASLSSYPASSLSSRSSKNCERILLDIFLPYNIAPDSCRAKFNTDNKVLTVTTPVVH